MRLGICDDMENTRRQVFEICKEVQKGTEKPFEIIEFENGEAVINETGSLDILILDIQMPGINGIEVKKIAEQQEWGTLIIFLTGFNHFVQAAFGYNVIGFVDKIQLSEKLPTELSHAFELYKRRQSSQVYIEDNIDSRTIKYVKSEHIYCKIVQRQGKIELVRNTLSNLEEKLQIAGFVRVHRSYLVNMNYIDKVCHQKIWVGEKEIPVSTRRWTLFKTTYAKYNM